jgi:hypothetical protein
MTAGCRQPGRLESIWLLCLWGGQNWKSRRRVHSTVICRGSILRMAAIRVLVQCHITGPSPQAAILCCNESRFPHWTHETVSVRPMAASRLFVRKMSCIAWYHVEFTESGPFAACKFFHTHSHRVVGYFRVIRIYVASSIVAVIARSTPYKRSLNCFIVSDAPGGAK